MMAVAKIKAAVPVRKGGKIAAPKPEKVPLSKQDYRNSIGFRINALRMERGLSLQALAKLAGVASHATILNWESNDPIPKKPALMKLAKIFNKPLMYLEYGIDGPVEVIPSAEKMGYELVPEVVFGESVSDREEVHKWGLPVRWLREELNIIDTNLALVYRVNNPSGKHEFGDRIIVDQGQKKPGPGEFLYWHGNAPAIGQMSVPIMAQGKKAPVKVRTYAGAAEETHEIDADKLQVIGRLRGTWRKSG